MSLRSAFAKMSLAGAAGVMAISAVAAPGVAAAQSGAYDSRSGYYYDPCKRDTTQRSTTGGLLGALAGAAIGSNVAARNARTEGAVLGALAGAAVGAGVGKSSAACESQRRSTYYNNNNNTQYGYNGGYSNGYYNNSYYNNGYYNNGYSNDYRYSRHDRDDDRYGYNVNERAAPRGDGCTLAESPIYLPDGRVQKRFVRVCPDSSGRYQVVE